MNRYIRKMVQGAALVFAAFVLLLMLADMPAVLQELKNFPKWLLLPLLGLKLLNWACRYMEWHVLLGFVGVKVRRGVPSQAAQGGQPAILRLRDSIIIFIVGFPMAISPGKVAEVLKAAIVRHLTGTPIARTAPVVLTERIVDGFAVLILIGIAALLGGEAVIRDVEGIDSSYVRGLILLTLAGMLLGLLLVQVRPLAAWLLRCLARIPLLRRAQPWLASFYASSYEVLQLKRLLPTISFGFVGYGTDCIALWLMLRGMGVEGGATLLAQASFILGFAVIVAALSAMPGGAGARELSTAVLLVGIVGVEEGVAQSVTLLNTFFQMGLQVLLGLTVGLLFRRVLFPPRLEDALAAEEPAAEEARPARPALPEPR